MPTGRVKRFDEKKGFGFVVCDGESQDIFVHYSDIIEEEGFKTLEPGQSVEFEISKGEKGMKALKVRKI